MQSVLERLGPGSRIAVIRLRSLGDCVLTTPSLDLLTRARPDLRIAIVVEERFREIFEGNPDVAEIHPPDPAALRRWRPELCLNLHGGARSAAITALSGSRFRAGFAHFRHQVVYNIRIPRAQEILGVERKVHTAEHLASAVFYLGVPRREIPRAKLISRAAARDPGPTAIIHPVAAAAEKTWRAEGFKAVAEYLRRSGIEPVFIGGARDDLSAFAGYRVMRGAPLGDIKTLLESCTLFLGNDSGPAHMAAACGVPVVVIFGPSDPAIWGPWRTCSEIVTSPGGIQAVEASQVIEAVSRLRVHA